MNSRKILWSAAAIGLLLAFTARADVKTELGLSAGYTDNIFADTSKIGDSYTRAHGGLTAYPSASTALSFSGAYTAFGRTAGLDYLDLQAALNSVFAGEKSPVSGYFQGSASIRRYGEYYSLYDRSSAGAAVGLQAELSQSIRWRAGADFSITEYNEAETGDNRIATGLTGLNLSLSGSNSLDLETGLNRVWLDQAAQEFTRQGSQSTTQDIPSELTTLLYRVRLSRPLGSRVGVSLSVGGRSFVTNDRPLAVGYSIDYLSPWADFWEGYTAAVDFKTFLIPNSILTFGASYKSAEYIDVLESVDDGGQSAYQIVQRNDDGYAGYIGFQRPINLDSGASLRPFFEVGFVSNTSTHPRYDYESLSVNLGLKVLP